MQDSNPKTEEVLSIRPWQIACFAFFLITLSFLIASRRNAVDIDLFHEMCLARQYVEEGQFPKTDAFAYTPTVEQVVHHEWGTGAIAYAVVEQMGLKSHGLMTLKYFLIALVCFSCCIAAKLRGARWPLIVPCFALATILGGQIGYTTIRAQLFTMLFLAIEFCLLALDQQGKKWWIGPWLVMVVIWANVHAGIVAGLGIFCFYVAFRIAESLIAKSDIKNNAHLIFVAIASILLLLVNPYGINYPFYLWYGTTLDRPLINEWKPLLSVISDTSFLTLIGISIFLAIVGFWKSWRERPFEVFVVMLTALLAFRHVRHLSIYAVTWACIVPASLMQVSIGQEIAKVGQRLSKPIAFLSAAAGTWLLVQCVGAGFWKMQVPSWTRNERPDGMLYPVGAVNHLKKSGFEGNLMVPFSNGAFVSWNLYPQVKVSIDSRYEVAYPPGSIEKSFDFFDAKDGWNETLNQHGTEAVLVPFHKPILKKIDSLKDWHLLYKDGMFSVYSKQEPPDGPFISDQNEFEWEF